MFHKKRRTGSSEASDGNTNQAAGEMHHEKSGSVKNFFRKAGRKLIVCLVVLAAVSVSVLLIVSAIAGSEGSRKSQKLAKKIGEPAEKAAASAKITLSDSSDFSFINELFDFTSLAESERITHVYGESVPEWTIYCIENSFGKLESVTYCDFRVLSSSINGVKKTSKIETSSIVSGTSLSEVNSVLNMDPYQIIYSDKSISRKYKYYYKDKQSGETKAYYITVMFGSDGTVNSPVITEENKFIFDILKMDND